MGVTTVPGRLLRITLIISETLEKRVITQATALGVEGYVCCYCSGKPLHAAIENTGTCHGLVRIELLIRTEVADGLLAFLDHLQRQAYPVTALIDHVQVHDESLSAGSYRNDSAREHPDEGSECVSMPVTATNRPRGGPQPRASGGERDELTKS